MHGGTVIEQGRSIKVSDLSWELLSSTTQPSPSVRAGHGPETDFNNDGMADIFWRNEQTGTNHGYFLEGASVKEGHPLPVVSPLWHPSTGDFDGDGIVDILWRHTVTGQNWLYLMNGASVKQSNALNNVALDWTLAGTGDFNGDGVDDLLWHNQQTGVLWLYSLDGFDILASQQVAKLSDTQWQIRAIADLNGDGNDDVVWRHELTGKNWVYLLDGHQIIASQPLNTVSNDWWLVGAGDFDGDGVDDLLWRHSSSGDNWIYFIKDAAVSKMEKINSAPAAWYIAQVDDFNGDEQDDILWRNNETGVNYIYFMSGSKVTGQLLNTVADTNWRPVSNVQFYLGGGYTNPNLPDNLPPVAQAGADVLVTPGTTVNFDGSASFDEDGSIASYSWDFGATTAQSSQRFDAEGTFLITLLVTDNQGKKDTDSVVVHVSSGGSTGGNFNSDYSSITLPGTMNSWDLFADSLSLIADFTWQGTISLTGVGDANGAERFKIVANNSWDVNWGSDCGQDGPDILPGLPAGDYLVTFDETTGCSTIGDGGNGGLTANAGHDVEIGLGCSATLSAFQSTGASSYSWSTGQSGMRITTTAFNNIGVHPVTLTATAGDGSQDTDIVNVIVTESRPVCQGAISEHGFPMGGEVSAGNYGFELAYPNLKDHFQWVTYIATDGRNIYVADREGYVFVFPDDPQVTVAQVKTLLDITNQVENDHEMGLLSMAFDPAYDSNGHFYLFYSARLNFSTSGEAQGDSVVSRFTVDNPLNPTSASGEVVVIREGQQGREHKGGQIQFHDGYMYVTYGDGDWGKCAAQDLAAECNGERANNNSQDLTNLRGTMIRIIVNSDGSYDIPADNPFVGNALARDEIYAYGLRNPWRFDIDPATGIIWEGDVGQSNWEEVNLIEKGGNYGWPVCDGTDNRGVIGGDAAASCTSNGMIGPETGFERNGENKTSIIGGIFYTGTALSGLTNSYFFADYDTARIWSYRQGEEPTLLVNKTFPEYVTTFGRDTDNEMLIGSFYQHDGKADANGLVASNIWRMVDQNAGSTTEPPAALSQSQLFDNIVSLDWANGVVPVYFNADKWRDGLVAKHYLALPAGKRIQYTAQSEWGFPQGTVLIEHVEVPVNGSGDTQRLNTLIQLKKASGWQLFNYRWNSSQTDALLLSQTEQATVSQWVGGSVQTRNHSILAGGVCSGDCRSNGGMLWNTALLNKWVNYGNDYWANQIAFLGDLGVFAGTLPDLSAAAQYVDPYNTSADLSERARVYLDINCAGCHADANGKNMAYDATLAQSNLIWAASNPGTYRIHPGVASDSSVYLRQQETSPDIRMPRGSSFIDSVAVQLMADWINSLDNGTVSSLFISAANPSVNKSALTSLSLKPNDSTNIYAHANFSNGLWAPVGATYQSSDINVVEVLASGRVNALASGTATITATYAGKSTTISVEVSDNTVTAINVLPNPVSLDTTMPMVVMATYGDGTTQNVTGSVSWSIVSGQNVVDISGSTLTRLAPGEAVVRATYSGLSSDVTVLQASQGVWVRFSNPENWGQVCAYAWNANQDNLGGWPGSDPLSDNQGWFEFELPESLLVNGEANIIFNNCVDTGQTDDLIGLSEHTSITGLTANDTMVWMRDSGDKYQLSVIGGSTEGNVTQVAVGSVVTVTAEWDIDQLFLGWTGSAVDFIVSDPTKPEVQVLMPAMDIELVSSVRGPGPGKEPYQQMCAGCHGADGGGGVGGTNLKASTRPLADLIEKIDLTMPADDDPSVCSGQCAIDVAEYVDYLRSFVDVCTSDDTYQKRQLRLLTRTEYNNSVADLLGLNQVTVANSFQPEKRLHGFDNNADQAYVFEVNALDYLDAAEELVLLSNPISTKANVAIFGKRAFRRPLTTEELTSYEAMFDSYGGAVVVQAMLNSPNFLYRSELGANAGNGTYVLSQYEIATALSYLFLQTTPSDTLLAAADANQLSTAAQIRSQAQSLLNQTTDAQRAVGDFALQWLGVQGLGDESRVNTGFDNVRDDMLQETRDFVNHVIFNSTGTYEELLTAQYTVASSELASYYGYAGSGIVNYSGAQGRSGLFGHGSFLSTFSVFDEPHPIKRAAAVRQNFLCDPLPLPNGVVAVFPEPDPNLTLKERFALHTNPNGELNPTNPCYSCHVYLDGIGFGFEKLDAGGQYRESDHGNLIDITGDVVSVEGINLPQTHDTYDTIPQMADIIANSNRAKACYAEKYYLYSKGYVSSRKDQCALRDTVEQFTSGSMTIQELMLSLIELPGLTVRK